MIRRVETKEDGRILIYYTFESSGDLNETKNRPSADLDKDQTSEEYRQ